jgi:plasmid stabilization system protein ParE
MNAFRYLLPAEEEMTEAAKFYEEQAHGLGTEFLDDVQNAVDRLLDNSLLGHEIGHSLRRILLTRFPYSIIYTIESEYILIIAVAH